MATSLESPEASPKKKRAFYSLDEKVGLCIKAELVVRCEKKMSFKAFCRENDVDPSQLRRWQKNVVNMKRALEETTRKKTKLTVSNGRPSALSHLRDRLIPWITSLQKEGRTISIRQVAVRAKRLDRSLRFKKRYTLFAMVRRFCKANDVVMRTPTHRSQEDPREKQEQATAFLNSTRPRIHQQNRHPAFIINMDQTPYNPQDTALRTLAKRGARTINAKKIKTSIGRITACLTVCADGTKLPPLLIYKGKPNGTVRREFKDYPAGAKYMVQENAWTDERVMLYWVNEVLKPYVENAPEGIIPYLLLDKYRCHYQGSVVKAIEDIGVEWDIIPDIYPPGEPWNNQTLRWDTKHICSNVYGSSVVSSFANELTVDCIVVTYYKEVDLVYRDTIDSARAWCVNVPYTPEVKMAVDLPPHETGVKVIRAFLETNYTRSKFIALDLSGEVLNAKNPFVLTANADIHPFISASYLTKLTILSEAVEFHVMCDYTEEYVFTTEGQSPEDYYASLMFECPD